MLLDGLITKWNQWIWGDRVLAVHLHLHDAEKATLCAILVERKKDELNILQTLNPTTSLEELEAINKEEIPTILVVTGKGIITKRIPRTVGGENEQVKQQLAEYGNTEITYSVSVQENWQYLSVLRSEVLDTWLTRLSEQKTAPVHLELGVPIISESLRFLDRNETVRTGQFEVEFDTHGLVSFAADETTSGAYSLAGDAIKGEFLLPYAGLIGFLTSIDQRTEPNSRVSGQWENTYYASATKKLGMVAVAALFAVLLVNAGLFMHYHDRQNVLEDSMMEYQGKLSELELLKTELERKQGIAAISGTGTNGRFAYYADQMAATVSPNIRLTRMTLNPILKRKRASDRMEVRPDVMEITGICLESEDLNAWMTQLRELDVVKGMRITGFEKKENGRQNEFSLEIQMSS